VLTAGSLSLTALVLANAWFQRQQFYPSVVYITKSNPSMAVIYLQSLVMVILTGKLMRKIFFGQLRAAEFEHLMERSWYAVTETCLAFTVFKDDFSPKFVALFTLLLFLKSFHWLAEDRVDYMERSPVITLLFHLRVLSLALVLASLDMFFMQHAYTSTLTKGASVQLVFGFEYAILLTIVLNTVVKYVLHSIDLHSETPWENKAVFMLYTELLVGLVKVLLYVLFFVIMVRIYTLPLFAVRPMYLTMRAFKKAFNDVVLSRRAIYNMNTLYPDATAEELANTDNVCIICREEMTAPSAKKLPCGHIFHRTCLRSWFQRQQTCPTCRLDVLRAAPTTTSTNGGGAAAGQPQPAANQAAAQQFQAQMAALRNQLEAMQAQRQQPAPAAQPQQPAQAAPQPPNFLNLLAGGQFGALPGFVPPPAGPAPAAPTPAAPAPAAGATAGPPLAGGAEGGTASPPSAGSSRPPFMFPPFPFLPYLPPPLPPANFSGLSDSELSLMEGQERSHVEARIKCLRNIQVLLDAAVMEMQQYSTVVARCNTTSGSAAASGSGSGGAPGSGSEASSGVGSAAASGSGSEASSGAGSAASPGAASTGVAPCDTTTVSESASTSTSGKAPTSNSFSSHASVSSTTPASSDSGGEGPPSTVETLSSGSSSTTLSKHSPSLSPSTNAVERPPSETGARPKVTSPPKECLVDKGDKVVEDKSEIVEENPFKKLSNEPSNRSAEQEEIRKRRLAVFEEQKKRLMSK